MESSSSLAQNDSSEATAEGESEQPASDFTMNIVSHERKTEESKPAQEVCTDGDENKKNKGNDPENSPPTNL